MREWIEDMVIAVARADLGKASPDVLDDGALGFHHDYQMAFYTWLHHKSHGTLPEEGGLLDQNWELVFEDWGALNQVYHRVIADLQAQDGDGDSDSMLDLIGEQPPDIGNWIE